MWVRVKIVRERSVFISENGPGSDWSEKVIERFWSELRGSLTFKLAVLVISIVIDCDRGHCYEHLKKKKSNSNEN